ncbi:MAG TPA: phenylalanine--tRNA ligase subunit beta, partial [Candidatus Saccharimonadales bacterium]|nr:phenylalanine--tRNA ligase subunit beta [Candidatus Saccharimonadales bacterium]
AKDVERDKDGLVQVVCGAPNVREGMLAAWLPPGATVPSTIGKDPFVLEARELRGEKSNGMLASPKELEIGDSHDGLLVLDKGQPGDDFAQLFKLDDYVLDIENKMFTHRPDCFGALGVAREVAGILHKPFTSPGWYVPEAELPAAEGDKLPLTVKNELPKLAPRFTAIAMRDVEVKPSPAWLQVALAKVGQKPVNNVVDLTNFYMLVTGQPLHAYDYDKVKKLSGGEATVIIRQPKKGEKLKLLNGKEIEPRAEAVMIATDQQLIGLGGVMGGTDTEVDANTKNIILECANFDMYSIRRTAMAHGLFTDAVTRFTKGPSPLQCQAVAAKTVSDIQKLAGGAVASDFIDDNHAKDAPKPVQVSADFINQRLGEKLPAAEMQKLLENVEFTVSADGEKLRIQAPFWRTDIEIPEDIVEEVGRLHGYDHLPLELPARDLTPAAKNPMLALKSEVRDQLSRSGANEVLTYSFVHGDLLDKVGQDKAEAFELSNALSPDLQYYRLSLVPSLLEKIHPNIKAGHQEFALFEIGRSHNVTSTPDAEGLPSEADALALVVAAGSKVKKTGAAYYQARKYLEYLVGPDLLEFLPMDQAAQAYQICRPYEPQRSALIGIKGGDICGVIGEFKPSVAQRLKLPKYTASFEINLPMLQTAGLAKQAYRPLSRFPSVKQDITLKVPADLAFAELSDLLAKELNANTPADSRLDVEPTSIFQKETDTAHQHVTFHVTVAAYERTLTDKEVNKLLDDTAAAAKAKFGAERV